MLSAIKNITSGKVSSAEKKQEIARLAYLIKDKAYDMRTEVDEIPAGRLPNPKLRKNILELRQEVESSMVKFEISSQSFKDWQTLDEIDYLIRRTTLRRYAALIPKDDEIRPFASFYEIFQAFQGCPPPVRSELKEFYHVAVRALFIHEKFESSLLASLGKKMKVLGTEGDPSENTERKKIEVFLDSYEESKLMNPELSKNADLTAYLSELEAVIYLQQQAEVLSSGQFEATPELVGFIDYWATYLNDLPPEYQKEKEVLVKAVEQCSILNNQIVEQMEITEEPLEVTRISSES